MRYQKKDIQVILGECTERTSLKLLTKLQTANPAITGIAFEYGHPKELIETLMSRSKNPTVRGEGDNAKGGKFDMWPIVLLFMDVDGEYGSSFTFPDYRLNMVVAMCTSPVLKAAERETKNFIPILTPIYEDLIKQMGSHICLKTQSWKQIKHTMTKRYFWGRSEGGNIANDYIDAIEIKNLELSIYN